MPAPHHSVFYRPDALTAAQPTASKHRRQYRHTGRPTECPCLSPSPCVHEALCVSVSLSFYLSFRLSAYSSLCVCVCIVGDVLTAGAGERSVNPASCLSLCLSVCFSVHPSVCLSVCICVRVVADVLAAGAGELSVNPGAWRGGTSWPTTHKILPSASPPHQQGATTATGAVTLSVCLSVTTRRLTVQNIFAAQCSVLL